MVLANLDGTYTCVIGDTKSFIFLEGLVVIPEASKESLGGYGYTVKVIQFTDNLEKYFASIREQNLKTWGIWDQWVRAVQVNNLHDPNTDTISTVYTYSNCLSGYDHSHKFEVNVVISNTTHHVIHVPDYDVFAHINMSDVHSINKTFSTSTTSVKNYTSSPDYKRVFAKNMTFRLYPSGKITKDTEEEEVICLKEGIECLKLWITSKFAPTKLESKFTTVHYNGKSYYWYKNRDSENPEGSGTVTDENNATVT